MTEQSLVYLDWAATAPLRLEAFEAMKPYMINGGLESGNANANALYSIGRDAFARLEQYRKKVSMLLGAHSPQEVIFTSGSTETCNMAIFGIAKALAENNKGNYPRVIVSILEHGAVYRPCIELKKQGSRVDVLKPRKYGVIDTQEIKGLLDGTSSIVAIQCVNNEFGSIQNVKEIARVCHENNAFLFCDMTQSVGKVPINLNDLGVDAACISSHKLGGPKGVGAFYLKRKTPFMSYALGGKQEFDIRSGTQNVCGIAGFASALEISIEQQHNEKERLEDIRVYTAKRLKEIPGVRLTFPYDERSDFLAPHIVHFIVKGYESETLILRLDQRGMCVSGGSACSTHSLEPSRTLTAIGISKDDTFSALRLSFGWTTEKEDIDAFIVGLKEVIQNE